MDFKEHWNLDVAMEVLQSKNVDAKLWAEAVEWLLLYGPPEIVSILLKASSQATDSIFAEQRINHSTPEDQVSYSREDLARSLGISEREALEIIARKKMLHNTFHFWAEGTSETIH